MYNRHTMSGVLEQIMGPKKQLVSGNMSQMDQKVLQLQAAKEILAEIFGTDVSDVEEMLMQRYEEMRECPRASRRHIRQHQACHKQRSVQMGEWPQEFSLAE